jgi:DNA-directed RNA polymerase alpha subunit
MATQPENDFPKMSRPAHQALAAAGYQRLEQLTKVTEAEIAKLHGMGPKGIRELKAALAERGWSFASKK